MSRIDRSPADAPDDRHLDRLRDRYAAALRSDPLDAEAAMGFGWCLRQLDGPAAAGPWFARAARIDPCRQDAVAEALIAAHELVVAGRAAPESAPPPLPDVRPTVSVIVCSITPWKLAALRANLGERLSAVPWELIHIGDARSLAEGYRRGIAIATGELLILCHDDIAIIAPCFLPRLLDALTQADLVGVAGTTRFAGPTLTWAGAGHVHGWIAHGGGAEGITAGVYSLVHPRVAAVEALDGVFLAARRALFDRVSFDPQTFDGFHGYDLDFSHRCHRAGYRVVVHSDLWLCHLSAGRFDQRYMQYARRLCGKFPRLSIAEERPVTGAAIRVPDSGHAVAIFRWLADWCRPTDATP